MIRSMDEQLRDIRETTDSGWACVHIDTCLSDYLQDHHHRDGELLLGVPVDGSTTVGEVLDGLEDEFRSIGYDLGSERKGFDYDKAKAALAAVREENSDKLGLLFSPGAEVPADDEDDMAEPCQAWFLLTWDVPEDEEEEEAS